MSGSESVFARTKDQMKPFLLSRAQRAEGLRVMLMYRGKMEFPFNAVPDNIQCQKCSLKAAWK